MAQAQKTQAQKKKFVISRVFVTRHVNFKSADAQVIVQGFGRLAGAMYRLGISLRAYLPSEKVDSLSDAIYEELVEPLKANVADELEKIQALCDTHSLKPLENYTYPIERDLKIFYPRALSILDIAQSLDTLVCRLNDLWFNGYLPDKEYFEIKEKYRGGLLHAARRIKNMANKTMTEARNRIASQEEREESSQVANAQAEQVQPQPEESSGAQEKEQEEESPALASVLHITAGV